MGVGKVIIGIVLGIFGWLFVFIGMPGNFYKYMIPIFELMMAGVDPFIASSITQVLMIFTFNFLGFINFPFIMGVILVILSFVLMILGAAKRSSGSYETSDDWYPGSSEHNY